MFGQSCALFLLLCGLTLRVHSWIEPNPIPKLLNSVQHRGRHLCNAIDVADDIAIAPAACAHATDLSQSNPPASTQLKGNQKAGCRVTTIIAHPEYAFLNNNVAVLQVQCPRRPPQPVFRTVLRNVTKGDLLTLAAFRARQRDLLLTPVRVADCRVCQQEYAVFDCLRQICAKAVGKYRSKVRTLDGLAGGALFTKDGGLAGMLSYGAVGGSLVAESLAFHEPFIRTTIQVIREL